MFCACFEHVSKAEHASSMGVLEEEGGSNRLLGLVAKQAMEFPQVLASNNYRHN